MEPKLTEVKRVPSGRPRLSVLAVALAVTIIILAIELPPSSFLGKADVVGYAICHRIAERSFFINGRQLPLCARCTGTFLGAVLGLAAMLLYGRRRASQLPPVPILGLLVVFTAAWGFDGLNSYLTFFPGLPHLYEPRNWLRLTTGLLNGLSLIVFVFPILNFTLWRAPKEERVIGRLWELVALLPVVALLVIVIQTGAGALLYPLAIASSLGVVMMLTILNSMIAALILGREGYAQNWRQALIPVSVGLALALVEMSGLVMVRYYLTTSLGLSF